MSSSEPADDVSVIVEYVMGRWLIDRIPWALWTCAGGLAVVLNTEGKPLVSAALAVVYLALLALAFAGWAITGSFEARSDLPFPAAELIGIVLAILVIAIITVVVGSVGTSFGRFSWTRLVDPPPQVFGWMLIYLGIGWIAHAVYRHVRPGTPVLRLSPLGISLHRTWLRDLLIPWREVQGVGPFDFSTSERYASFNPNAIAVLVSQQFHERHIASKVLFFAPPGHDMMFRPTRGLMQVVLTSPDVVASPRDYLGPIEARWTAFRDRPGPVPDPGGPPVKYGRWSGIGSRWRLVLLIAPIVAMAAIALHATGIWRS